MGRKGKKWQKKGSGGGRFEKPKRERPPNMSYETTVRENKDFETYYKAQNLVREEEWDTFLNCLKKDLPAALRITGTKTQARSLLNVMKKEFFLPLAQLQPPELSQEEIEAGEEPVKPLKPLCWPWYPDGLAWQLNLTRRDIRRCESYWRLHQFLISETESGNISRQEAVSMIPPLVLDVQPHHKVLDMCAAPGSKTAQLIEFLHSSDNEMEAAIPPGVVVANDADNKRCYMLTHQAKRLQSPSIIITNHDAAFMPNVHHSRKDGSTGPMKFDRILCDVPCSGDGTMRKNFDVWSKWNAANGANLHGLQMRIARRGLEMLTVGGQMVYSTCSLNPLEDEAVIHRILVEASGSCELVDVSDQLPGLEYTQGLNDWTIMNRELEVIETPGDIPIKNTNLFNKHQFPPAPEDRDKFKLNRCLRILPHQQDTGGFFVALIRKTKPLPGEKIYVEKEPNSVTELATHTQRTKQPPKKKRRQGFKEEPYFYFTKEEVIWPTIHEFYGLKEDVDPTLFLARTKDGKKRNVYFTNALVKDIVLNNEDHIKIINTGVKVLVRSDNKGARCDFRLAQEGCQVFLPLHTNRKIEVKKEDLIVMLLNNDMELPPEISTLHPDTQKTCASVETGSAVFTYREGDISIDLVGWKGNKSVRAYVARNERMHHLRLLGADTSKYEKNKFQEQKLLKNGRMEMDQGKEASEEKGENEEEKDGDDKEEMMDGDNQKTINNIKEKVDEWVEDLENVENTSQVD